MGTFLRGWRRKTGCVMLVMALMATGAWIRSYVVGDEVVFSSYVGRWHILASELGEVQWTSRQSPSWRKPEWSTIAVGQFHNYYLIDHENRYCPVRYTEQTSMGTGFKLQGFELIVPYWLIAGPFTLLSAYLILWTPRKRFDQQKSPPDATSMSANPSLSSVPNSPIQSVRDDTSTVNSASQAQGISFLNAVGSHASITLGFLGVLGTSAVFDTRSVR